MARIICGRLKRREGIWRVDGIGCIRPSNTLGSRLAFHFSQIHPENINNPYAIDASTKETYTLNGHSSWLKLFTPGSLWEKGEKTHSPALLNQHFVVDTNRCIYTFPDKISEFAPFATLFPNSHLDFGDNYSDLKNTKFALVPVMNVTNPTTKWLIIPMSELFRFYVGNSTRLISSALTATTDKLIDIKKTTLIDHVLTIFDLTGTLTLREACFFGRSKTCDAAMETYFGPHKYLAAAKIRNDNDPLYIDCSFPFNGKTTLHVTGKRIPLRNTVSDQQEWAVLVTQIRHCSYHLGINHVEIVCMGTPSGGSGSGNRTSGPPPKPRKTDLEDPTEINDTKADPLQGKAIARNPILSNDPLNRITYNRIILSKDEFEGVRGRDVNTPTGYTFENGAGNASGSGNQQLDIVDVTVKDVSRDIMHFIEMLKELRKKTKKDGWEITTLGSDDSVDKKIGDDVITSFPKMGKKFRWYLVFDRDNTERRRYAVWVKIKVENKYVYLAEMELKGTESGRSVLGFTASKITDPPIEFSVQNFKDLLTITAVHNGWPPNGIDWKDKAHKDIADRLFEEFDFARITHVYLAPTKKNNTTEKKNSETQEESTTESTGNDVPQKKEQKGPVAPEEWANDIYCKIRDSFF